MSAIDNYSFSVLEAKVVLVIKVTVSPFSDKNRVSGHVQFLDSGGKDRASQFQFRSI